ncbi:MAG: tetratricopeptide repeat protein [bacterium]
MSAIQEALERVRKERQDSPGNDLSWVEVAATGPRERSTRPRLKQSLGILVLAGAAVGMILSQVSWTALEKSIGGIGSWKQHDTSGFQKGEQDTQQGEKPMEPITNATSWEHGHLQATSRESAAHSQESIQKAVAEAKMLQKNGDSQGAQRVLLSVLEKEPESVEVLVELAGLYMRDSVDFQRAIALYERALQRSAQRASIWVNLGVAYMRIGDPRKAQEKISRALQLDPSMLEAHYNMACALALQGKDQEAAVFLQRAASMDSRVMGWASQDPDLQSLKDVLVQTIHH